MSFSDFISKQDVAVLVGLIFVGIFAGIIVMIFYNAELKIVISGSLDPNTLIVVFLGIVNSVIIFLGIRRVQTTPGKNNG